MSSADARATERGAASSLHPYSLTALLAATLGATACGDPSAVANDTFGDTADRAWTTPDAWALVHDGEDPYAETVPDADPCAPTELGFEGDGASGGTYFEILTETCNYATVMQPSRVALYAGDTVELALWHNPLRAAQSALAEVRVVVDTQELASWQVAIPAQASVLSVEVTLDRDIAKASPVYFHVHNHGSNAWRVGEWWVH